MRPGPEFPLQSSMVEPSRLRLGIELSHRAGTDHALCRINVTAGLTGEQLGLWVGPCPPFTEPNDLRRWAQEALASCLHSINVEYFGGEPF